MTGWITRRRSRRVDQARAVVVEAMTGTAGLYGYDLMVRTGLGSGRLYPALAALQADGTVRGTWDYTGPWARRMYVLSDTTAPLEGHP